MAGRMNLNACPAPARIFRALLGLLLFSTLFQCAVSAPRRQWQHPHHPHNSSIEDPGLSSSILSKRWFVPTDAQADQALIAAKFDGSRAIFYSRPAPVRAWATKLNLVPITRAYDTYLDLDNQDGPFWQITADVEDGPIWAVLSAAYARAVPAGATTYVALNPGQVLSPTSNWVQFEEPVLQQKGCTIFQVNAQDTNAAPVQIFPPPALGAPPP